MTALGLIMAILASAAVVLFATLGVVTSYKHRDALLGGFVWAAAGLLVVWSIWAAWQ